MHQCSIWTDGYYAIKAKTYDGKEKFAIEDFIFKEIKEGIFDDGNIVIKDQGSKIAPLFSGHYENRYIVRYTRFIT